MTNSIRYTIQFNVVTDSSEAARAKLTDYLHNGIPEDFDWEKRLHAIPIEKRQYRSLPPILPIGWLGRRD